MRKPVCLITGATDGVGRSTALELARRGFHVVIAARDAAKAEATRREITTAAGTDNVEVILADLASLRQVRRLAKTFGERQRTLDVLVNNAGVFLPHRVETEDGFEASFQINYLSHFLLTQLLLEPLGRSPQGRIINLSSSVHSIGKFEVDNLQSDRRFSVLGTYATSKLLVLMFTEELAKRLAGTGVTVNAVHPGIVRTPMMLRAPGALRVVSWLSLPFSVSPAKGAETTVYLATSPEVEAVSGRYFVRSRQVAPGSTFDTEANRALLWDLSMRAANLDGSAAPLSRAAS
jgi:NAD(P)-dependent dehydrogenase (short-subunit alcohol dehydrogenase family)